MTVAHAYPIRLRALQLQLHRVTAEYRRLCAELPWSVEPMPGWKASEHHYSHRGDVLDSPGYTEDQKHARALLEKRLRRLSAAVCTHPFWESVEAEQRVTARMGLKRVEACTPEEA
ncbi:hypothetical protein [Streptomyces sp. NPDC012888]|uniref:hypothetical protein n=1 Tax=Streptomyces sp. NPDC012888 TaxID=3364855 RepID=UPI0036B64539